MINKLCGYVGCSALAIPGRYFCAVHQKQSDQRKEKHAKDFSRLAQAERAANYSSPEWRRLKANTIRLQPYCSYCGSPDSLQVHHIKPARFYPELFLDQSNLMVLCRVCHANITRREINQRRKH